MSAIPALKATHDVIRKLLLKGKDNPRLQKKAEEPREQEIQLTKSILKSSQKQSIRMVYKSAETEDEEAWTRCFFDLLYDPKPFEVSHYPLLHFIIEFCDKVTALHFVENYYACFPEKDEWKETSFMMAARCKSTYPFLTNSNCSHYHPSSSSPAPAAPAAPPCRSS